MKAYSQWRCGICDEDCDSRHSAERHCSELVDRDMDPMEGRIPIIRRQRPQPFEESVYGDGRLVTA